MRTIHALARIKSMRALTPRFEKKKRRMHRDSNCWGTVAQCSAFSCESHAVERDGRHRITSCGDTRQKPLAMLCCRHAIAWRAALSARSSPMTSGHDLLS